MENIRGSYNNGLDEYGLKLRLQEKLLSKILNQNNIRIYHLGAIPERLCGQKVLIILDDVNDMKQLEALVNETNWFGPGSRIIVTTEDQELLEKHGIKNIYHVGVPTKEEAREIFCRYTFKRSLAPYGFEKLVERVIQLCSKLPLGLRVIGSALYGKNEDDWEVILRRLENSIDRDIERVLRVGFDSLHENDQSLFLLIAFFFNYRYIDYVMAMLDEKNLDVRLGLKILAYKSLIQISTKGEIVMHNLLQQVGREAVQRQDPRKRQILIDNDEISDLLENDFGSRSVMDISLDISSLSSDVYINSGAFKRTHNLRFLNIYKTIFDRNGRLHVPEDMNFPPRLRLLHWEEYPGKCLPSTFRPEYLVELNLHSDWLEKLWEGIQPLTNLKKMSLAESVSLKELPNLSKATNLEWLNLDRCFNLVEIPSSFGNLHKLNRLDMAFCLWLQVVPTHINLASLKSVNMLGCYRLSKFPDICTNITTLSITGTMLQDLPESIRLLSCLHTLFIDGGGNAAQVVAEINLNGGFQLTSNPWIKKASYIKDLEGLMDIEKIPDWIKDLHGLKELHITDCPKLASLPELPASLRRLRVYDCESLETLIPFPEYPVEYLYFSNCLKLGEEARRVITQQSRNAWLPGTSIPVEFDHRAIGNSLTIPSGTKEYRLCVLFSPKQHMKEYADLLWRLSRKGFSSMKRTLLKCIPMLQADHLFRSHFISHGKLESDLLLEFSTTSNNIDVIECGFQSFTDETNRSYD